MSQTPQQLTLMVVGDIVVAVVQRSANCVCRLFLEGFNDGGENITISGEIMKMVISGESSAFESTRGFYISNVGSLFNMRLRGKAASIIGAA